MLHDDPEAGRRNSIEDEVTEMELDVMKRLIKKYEPDVYKRQGSSCSAWPESRTTVECS